MKSLVIYYSRSGKTKAAAEAIADVKKSDIRKIEEIFRRDGILGFIRSFFDAVTLAVSDLKPMDFDLTGYDTIYLCSPVWAFSLTPAMRSFIRTADFKGKKVYLFAIGYSGKMINRIVKSVKNTIESSGGLLIGKTAVKSGGRNEAQLKEFIKNTIL